MNNEIRKEIIKNLDELEILYFKEQYNKSEIERIMNMNQLDGEQEIKNRITELYNQSEYAINDGFELSIGQSSITIQKLIDKDELSTTYQEVERISSTIMYKLPYNYSMGRKISKKAFENTMAELGLS